METKLLGGISIDSVRLRIPIAKVQILDSHINRRVLSVIADTGEVIDQKQKKDLLIERNGVRLKAYVGRTPMGEESLYLGVHSKFLGERYFEGITKFNLKLLYESLMGFEKFHLSYDTFVTSCVTDVDFKQDFLADNYLVEDALTWMAKYYIARTKIGTGVKVWHKGLNGEYSGHQFNERESRSPLKSPYLKVYQKYYSSLQAENKPFFDGFGIEVNPRTWRMEWTLKDKKGLATFGMKNRLLDITETSQETLDSVRVSFLQSLFVMKPRKETTGIAPKDKVLFNLIEFALDNSQLSFSVLLDLITRDLDKANKSKRRKHINEIWMAYFKDSEVGKKDVEKGKILSILGWGKIPYY